MQSYQEAQKRLGGRDSRKVENHTYLQRREGGADLFSDHARPGICHKRGGRAMRQATLTNVDRSEYGVIAVDLDLLLKQIGWLSTCEPTEEREGILNLLGGIMDLADPPDEEDEP